MAGQEGHLAETDQVMESRGQGKGHRPDSSRGKEKREWQRGILAEGPPRRT